MSWRRSGRTSRHRIAPGFGIPNRSLRRAFGDTIGGGVRILTLDRENETAGITARNTKNLIVLAVVPGREIEVIMPGGLPLRRDRQAGHYFVDMRRVDDNIRPMNADEDAAARLAYDRCMAQAAATERRLAQQKRTVKRDSTGKVIDDGGRGEAISVDQQRALQASCDRLADTEKKRHATAFLRRDRRPTAIWSR
ncbi:MAG: hypothetical protein IPP90_00380 [Gemmatimonadaceae bacterium]|nr:hypothetical protein [Gemmatimonadaceae bacterium]